MKSSSLRRAAPYLCLAALTLLLCQAYVGRQGVFASGVDWISQHSVFPEYFRQQFYATGQLFPEFAAGIGGGQNIYNFSYYGLYSPVILPGYFLPFVKMSDYLMGASIVCLIASVLLMYRFLENQGFAPIIRTAGAAMFLLAGPMIFHSYRHVMFVNYMPFLLMALLGIDRYYQRGRRGLYISGVFLMIMTSFYFSIGGLLALGLYGLCSCPREKRFAFLHLILPTAAAVLGAGVLLVPTALTLLTRTGSARAVDVWKLLTPDPDPTRFVYGSYGVGVTTLTLTALWVELCDKKRRRLSLGCLIVLLLPLFSWLLNGGLYVRDKALIPFLPLLCLLTAAFLQRQRDREISVPVGLAGYLLTAGLCGFFALGESGANAKLGWLIFAESGLFFLCFLGFWRRHLALLAVPPLVCLFLFGFGLHSQSGKVLDREPYVSETDPAIGEKISEVLRGEPDLYRLEQGGDYTRRHADLNRIWDSRQWITSVYSSTYGQEYQEFREDTFGVEEPFRNDMMQAASKNPLFQKLMGVKYVVERDGDTGEFSVETRPHAAPVIYATDKLLSPKAYARLPFPYNQTALMRYAVAAGGQDAGRELRADAKRIRISLSEEAGLKQHAGGYRISADETVKAKLSVPEEHAENPRLLYLRFQVQNNRPGQDVTVTVDGIRNRLSARSHIYYNGNTAFTYVTVLEEGETSVKVSFGAGDYQISGLQSFLGGTEILEDGRLYRDAFSPDWEQTKGNRICGEIKADSPGFLVTSIPYDKGFTVEIDGKTAAVQRVNTAFLGAPMGAGTHRVEITYHAPGAKAGKLVSCVGMFLWALTLLIDRRKLRRAMHESGPLVN